MLQLIKLLSFYSLQILSLLLSPAYSSAGDDKLLLILIGIGIVILLSIILPVIYLIRGGKKIQIVSWICVIPVLTAALIMVDPWDSDSRYFLIVPVASTILLLMRNLRDLYGRAFSIVYIIIGVLIMFICGGFIGVAGSIFWQLSFLPYVGYFISFIIMGLVIYQLLRRMNAHGLGAPTMEKSIVYSLTIAVISEILPWIRAFVNKVSGESHMVPTTDTLVMTLIHAAVCVLGAVVAYSFYSYMIRQEDNGQ